MKDEEGDEDCWKTWAQWQKDMHRAMHFTLNNKDILQIVYIVSQIALLVHEHKLK